MLDAPNYDIVRTIGSGAFGYVFQAIDRSTGKTVALKRIEKVGKGMSRQNEMLYMLKDCPNIIQIKNLFYSENEEGKLVQNIVFEYFDDNLQNIIQRHRKNGTRIPPNTIKSYMYQIVKGMYYVHSKQIAHRDLKPENILMSKEGYLNICDFGCSKVIDPNGKNTPYMMSRYYRAPEMILGISKYSVAIDIWSVGCIMAELATLDPIFVGKNEGDQLFAILKVMGSFSFEEEKKIKKRVAFEPQLFEAFRGFQPVNFTQMFKMIKPNTQFIDLLLKMLAYIPQERITAAEALRHPYFKDVEMEVEKINLFY